MMPVVDRPTIASRPRTLVVALDADLTATLLDPTGAVVAGPARTILPPAAEPELVLKLLWSLVETLDEYDRTTFVIHPSPSLAAGWDAIEPLLATQSMRPVRVVRAAELFALPVIHGVGTEMVLTLGPTFGAALFVGGREVVMDLGAHPFRKKASYAEYIGGNAWAKQGRKKWNKRVQRVLGVVLDVFKPDRLYLTGRDAATVSGELPANVSIVPDRSLQAALAVWS